MREELLLFNLVHLTIVLVGLSSYNKIPWNWCLEQQMFIFHISRSWEVLRSRCQQIWFLMRAFFLVCRQLPSLYVLIWPFLHVWREGWGDLLRSPVLSDWNPTLRPHLILIMSWKPYLQIQSHWRLGPQYRIGRARVGMGGQCCIIHSIVIIYLFISASYQPFIFY